MTYYFVFITYFIHRFMRQLDPSLTDNEISEMINGAEMDGDGEIDIDEFKAMTSQYIV